MRERIKASADRHGVSMNEEIVAVLDREFPDASLATRSEELRRALRAISPAAATSDEIASLVEAIAQLANDIADGAVATSPEVKEAVRSRT